MPIDTEGKAVTLTTTISLLLVGIGGILLLVISHAEPWWLDQLWAKVTEDIGKAFIVAAIIGLLIDRALKNNLVKDAVAASLGYLLPNELKNELGWIYGQSILATQSFHVRFEYDKNKDDFVTLYGTINRTLKNISGEQVLVRVGGGTEEWFSGYGESEITKCEFTQDNTVTPIVPTKDVTSVSYEYSEKVKIPRGKSIDIHCSYILRLPSHGSEFLTYQYPIESPLVVVEAPNSLHIQVAFSHRDKYRTAISSVGSISHRLNGVLIPHQPIIIFWHDVNDMKERTNRLGS